MQNVTDLLKSVRDKAYSDGRGVGYKNGYKDGDEAGYRRAFEEIARAAQSFTDSAPPSRPRLEDMDIISDDEDGKVRPGTSQAFALAGVRDNPGSTGADIQRYCAAHGHDKAYPQIYTALKRLQDKGLVMNNDGKWIPLAGPESP